MQKPFLFLFTILFIMVSCRQNDAVPASTISFKQSAFNLLAGDTVAIKPQFSDDAISKKKLTWSVTPANIAKIAVHADNSCTLTALISGKAEVQVVADDNLTRAILSISVSYPVVNTILWVGTSIPQGCTYAVNSCKALGYKCINNSIGSSGIRLHSGIINTGRDGRDLSETIAEKKARYKDYVSTATLEEYYNYSFERVILPYLDKVEVIVFDHGYNDINKDVLTGIDWTSLDRTTYIGAFNYLMKEILTRKPSMRVVIGGYFENQSNNPGQRSGKAICEMQEAIATHYNYALLDVWNFSGIKYAFVPNTSNYIKDFNAKYGTNYTNYIADVSGNITDFQIFCPDSVHPFTDFSGNSDRKLDAIYIDLLKKKLSQ